MYFILIACFQNTSRDANLAYGIMSGWAFPPSFNVEQSEEINLMWSTRHWSQFVFMWTSEMGVILVAHSAELGNFIWYYISEKNC